MKWSEICIHTTQEAVEPISHILHEAGASGVVIEDLFDFMKERENVYGEIYQLDPHDYPEEGVRVKAYLAENSFLAETIDQIKEAINNLLLYEIDLGKNEVSISEVNEEEWATAWKKYYHPIQISDRITIVPTWEEYEKKSAEEMIIELDPGMAFGTGTHPTTVMCIQALDKYVQKDDQIIDVGTGSGVLAIAAAKLGAQKVDAYDLDDVAVNSAKENVQINKVEDIVSVGQNNLLNNINGTYDIIVGNLLAEIILRFVGDTKKILKKGGYFITSGIINGKKQDILDEYEKYGYTIVEVFQIEDWVAIVGRNDGEEL